MTDDHKDMKFLARFAVFLVTVVMIYLGAVTFAPLPETGIKYADIAVPLLLGTVIGAVIGYWFGASKAVTSSLAGATPAGTPTDPVATKEVTP